MRRRALSALSVAAIVVIAGCGGGSKATKSERKSDTSSLAALRALGGRALLLPTDLPGWSSSPPEPEAKEPTIERTVARCIGTSVSVIEDKPAEVHSRRFKRGGAEVSNDVTVSVSAAEAAATFAAWSRPNAGGCLAKGIQTALRQHLLSQSAGANAFTFHRPRVRSLTLGTLPAAAVRGYRFEFSVDAGTDSLRLYFDAVLLRSGRTNATVTFGDQGGPVHAATEKRLASLVATRLGRVPATA
jgi:hypothetical protein